MDLYLMQHGLATAAEEDPARPLTPEGRAEVERVAARAAGAGVRATRVVHSGKLRAEQTAGILARALGAAVESRSGLDPADPVGPVAAWLREQARSTPDAALALVGHLPFLDRLASELVAGDADAHVLRFRNAGLVRLVPSVDARAYSVAWVLTPELV